jgi:hypothetical protein
LLREENIVSRVTLPAASITANSDPVGAQHKCFKGPPSGFCVNGGVFEGSLNTHSPFSGLQRRFRNSKASPSEETDATLPHFDQAIVLQELARVF